MYKNTYKADPLRRSDRIGSHYRKRRKILWNKMKKFIYVTTDFFLQLTDAARLHLDINTRDHILYKRVFNKNLNNKT